MKKFLPLFLSMLFIALGAAAQGQLTGTVKDGKGQPLSFVNVAVLKVADNTVVTGTVAGIEGDFQIQAPAAGQYRLKLSLLGFAPVETAPFAVTSANYSKNFGNLVMQEDVTILQEAVVQATRPTVMVHADKTVVNVEGTAMAAGATALEVLTKSPGVWADQDGNITLNGKPGVQVMIDGRTTYLTGKELQNLLQSMPAENVKDLEIIRSPSSRYDAEGLSGVININLKKNTQKGLNGSAYAGYQYAELHGYTAGADLNYKQGRWSGFTNLDAAERTRFRINNMHRFNNANEDMQFTQRMQDEGKRFVPALRFGTDYAFSDKHSIGITGFISRYSTQDKTLADAFLRNASSLNDLHIKGNNLIDNNYSNTTLNLHYQGKTGKAGTSLSADLDYIRLMSDGNASYLNRLNWGNDVPVQSEQLSTENPAYYNIYSARTDFTTSTGKSGRLEMGAKASRVVSDNELLFYITSEGAKRLDDNRSNHFVYNENIFAAYTNYSAKLGEKWSLQSGVRAEHTITNGRSVTLDQNTKRSYLNLFPNLLVQQKVNDAYEISYSYNRRINRPRYEILNPFMFYLDRYTIMQGNPYLKPQYAHAFSLTQTLQQRYSLVLDYTVTRDYMAEVPARISSDNVMVLQHQNMDNMKSFSATLTAPIRVSAKWEMNNNATILQQRFAQRRDEQLLTNNQVTFLAQSNNSIKLPAVIRMEVNAGYQGPMAYGLYKLQAKWWLDAGLKRSFANDKLDLSVGVTDIFRANRTRVSTNLNGTEVFSNQYNGTQSFRVNLRYRFNKGEKFEAKKRSGELDEVGRAGGR